MKTIKIGEYEYEFEDHVKTIKIGEYEFEDHPDFDVQLHAVRNDRIIGSYQELDIIVPFTVDLEGTSAYNIDFDLTPYDKHKDLKKAESEGAIIEYSGMNWCQENNPGWHSDVNYRIKGGISIESWNAHKELIKQWWNGAEIEMQELYHKGRWYDVDKPIWNINCLYQVKPKPINIYKDVIELYSGKHCCWVHEDGGYFAYCYSDGRPKTRTGNSEHICRTWSTVGDGVLFANNLKDK